MCFLFHRCLRLDIQNKPDTPTLNFSIKFSSRIFQSKLSQVQVQVQDEALSSQLSSNPTNTFGQIGRSSLQISKACQLKSLQFSKANIESPVQVSSFEILELVFFILNIGLQSIFIETNRSTFSLNSLGQIFPYSYFATNWQIK